MPAFRLAFQPSVEKDLRNLHEAMVSRIIKRVESLGVMPFPPGCAKLSSSERLYRVRVGDYRIVYEVDGELSTVTVHYIRHRRDVYRRIS